MENNNLEGDDLSFVVLGPNSMTNDISLSPISSGSSQLSLGREYNVPQRLDQLIAENCELRETLNKTNVTMKAQFETLTNWQHEVLQTHESHKKKFEQTRALVIQLKSENIALKKGLAEQNDNDIIRDLKATINELGVCNNKLVAENLVLVEERNAYREKCAHLMQKIVQLENVARTKCNDVDKTRGNSYESLAYSVEQSLHQAERSSIVVRDSGEAGGNSVSDWCHLGSKPIITKKDQELLLVDAEKRIEALKEDLGKQCDENMQLAEKLRVSGNEVKQLNSELEKKCALFNSAMKQLELERDEAAVIKARMEVYKADYEEERAAREKAIGERENLAEELRLLKDQMMRQQSSSQEVRQVSTNEENLRTDAVAATSQSGMDDEFSSNRSSFSCFMCDKGFRTLTQLQTHVEECLNQAQ